MLITKTAFILYQSTKINYELYIKIIIIIFFYLYKNGKLGLYLVDKKR